ncbi:MAG: hypothetical protein HZB29_07505 [Nitrospinae bacterium]|nr:hypothetical protein [Nitrospinota bacterium]
MTLTATDTETPKASYEAVRYNAVTHGILSRLVVLPHENAGEFADLLSALIEEHQPTAMTERHLVEELAAIIWRKRRVLMGEGAAINKGLKSVTMDAQSVIPAAAPFQRGLFGTNTDLSELVTSSPGENAENLQYAEATLKTTERAEAILRKGGANAYEKARRALQEDSREWFDENVEDESCKADSEGLAGFIRESLLPFCYRQALEAKYQPAIRAQTLGEGLQVHRLETLNRYETHLDRKFERTLSMLLKLKELRGRR